MGTTTRPGLRQIERHRVGEGRRCLLFVLELLAAGGCERAWRHGFIDPTQTGRFESKPIQNDIRRSLGPLEEPEGIPGAVAPTHEDLVVTYEEAAIGPGDVLDVSVFELVAPGQPANLRRTVNEVGCITLPTLGEMKVAGLTPRQLELQIAGQLKQSGVLHEPEVAVIVVESHARHFSVVGNINRVGEYPLPRPDYRVLNVLAAVGPISPEQEKIYVFRGGHPETADGNASHQPSGDWSFVDNEWVEGAGVAASAAAPKLHTGSGQGTHHHDAETPPRIIEVDIAAVQNGDMRQNMVIRPHDILNFLAESTGQYFVTGHVARPGAYSLEGESKTVKQAIAAAGGFDLVAWPSRVEIIRRLPGDQEEIRSINLDRILGGDESDVFLRPNDIINVGTNAVAPFLATIRNSFRLSYGFGFVYDRNFADIDSYSSRINPQIRQQSREAQRRAQLGIPPGF